MVSSANATMSSQDFSLNTEVDKLCTQDQPAQNADVTNAQSTKDAESWIDSAGLIPDSQRDMPCSDYPVSTLHTLNSVNDDMNQLPFVTTGHDAFAGSDMINASPTQSEFCFLSRICKAQYLHQHLKATLYPQITLAKLMTMIPGHLYMKMLSIVYP